MRRPCIFHAACLSIGLIVAPPAFSMDYGLHISSGDATLDGYRWGEDSWGPLTRDRDVGFRQFGATMDFGNPEDGYRFRALAGYQTMETELADGNQDGVYLGGQIGLISPPDRPVQFWVGPALSVGYLSGNAGSGQHTGIGAALGLDLNLNQGSIGLELEYQSSRHSHFDESDGGYNSDDLRFKVTYMF